MALGGTNYNDLNIRQYTDMIEHELQQDGSRLRDHVTVETAMGERKYFNKIGTLDSYIRTGRLEDVQLQDMTLERRYVTHQMIESAHAIDPLDLLRYQRSPQPEVAQAIAKKLGRDMDLVIASAFSADASRELNGAISNAQFDSNFVINVNSNSLAGPSLSGAAMTGDTGLHEGKIFQAIDKIVSAYGANPGDPFICVAPNKQLSGLRSRKFSSGAAGFFAPFPAGNGTAGDLNGLGGNVVYVPYEELGVDGSNDEIAYLFTKDAIKLAIWQDVQFHMDVRPDKASRPTQMMANMAIGAVRMFEEKIVKILCDPNRAYV